MAINCRILKKGNCEITQYYGGNTNHLGIDIAGKNHTIDDVIAHSDGIVEYVQTGQQNNQGSTGNISYGNFIKLNHGNGCHTLYAHLDSVNVKVGDKVSKGYNLGRMGNTGNSYGAHLHFEVWENNIRINPTEYLNTNLFTEITSVVNRDETKNQLKVNVSDLRIRESYTTNSEILGLAKQNGIYNFYDSKENEGYTWYKISDNEWMANKNNWCEIYFKKNSGITVLEQEILNLKEKILFLERENQKLKQINEDYKIFVAPNAGLYYINLKAKENLIYKKNNI